MTLDSTSTDAAIKAAYDDNAAYDLVGSVAMAREFIVACRLYIRRVPKMVMHGGANQIVTDISIIQEMERKAQRWLASQPVSSGSTSPGVVQETFENFRG